MAARSVRSTSKKLPSVTNSGLRLHVEEQIDEPLALGVSQLGPLLSAFEQATGWELRYEQSNTSLGEVWSATVVGCGQAGARLTLMPSQQDGENTQSGRPIELTQARPLAL